MPFTISRDGTETTIQTAEGLATIPEATLDALEVRGEIIRFPGGDAVNVIRDWVRKLKWNGEFRIAVPDFDRLIDAYRSGTSPDVEAKLLGERGENASIWNRGKVSELLRAAGLEEITNWNCAADDFTLGIRARRCEPIADLSHVEALISMPRLAWTENMFCAIGGLIPLRINLTKHTGAFWNQCLARLMEQALAKPSCKWILTLDYDTIFTREDVVSLYRLATRDNLDAVAAMQIGRERPTVLITCNDNEGKPRNQLTVDEIEADALEVATAHFGLTLIRADALRQLPKPWFHGSPAPDGSWNEGRTDDDIQFWRAWKNAGFRVWQANKIRVGHMQVVVTWPDQRLAARHQYHSEFISQGKPDWAR